MRSHAQIVNNTTSVSADAAIAEANRLVDEALARLDLLRARAAELGRPADLDAFESLAIVARFVVGRDR